MLSCFGTKGTETLGEEGTLFAHLAKELLANLRTVWTPDFPFLKGLRRRQLLEIARDADATKWRPSLANAGQGELALALAEFFKASTEGTVGGKSRADKAKAWVPACMKSMPDEAHIGPIPPS